MWMHYQSKQYNMDCWKTPHVLCMQNSLSLSKSIFTAQCLRKELLDSFSLKKKLLWKITHIFWLDSSSSLKRMDGIAVFSKVRRPTYQENKTAFLHDFFSDLLSGEWIWPPRSPILTPSELFLWGFLELRVYRRHPQGDREGCCWHWPPDSSKSRKRHWKKCRMVLFKEGWMTISASAVTTHYHIFCILKK